jgi:hypothetical protein
MTTSRQELIDALEDMAHDFQFPEPAAASVLLTLAYALRQKAEYSLAMRIADWVTEARREMRYITSREAHAALN